MSDLLLEVVEGPDAGRQVRLQGPLEIGRDSDAGLVLNDDQVSRRHARLTPEGSSAVLEDLGSSNGTFVNHNELHGPAHVTPGDEVLIGVSVLQVRAAQEVAAQPSAVRAVPPALAHAPQRPTFTDPVQRDAYTGVPELDRLVDAKTKSQARTAPLAIFALVVLVVLIYLATS